MDWWMIPDLTSFLTVLQSYQDDQDDIERLCAMEPCLRLVDFALSEARTRDR